MRDGFSSWPCYSEAEIRAVAEVLRSNRVNYWTGTECKLFETEFAEFFGSRRSIALANGTVALEAALYALGIGTGDEVIVTPRSFIASVAAVALCGARPVFADVDPDSQNLTADSIEAALTKRTKAIILVHLAGWPCEMEPILELARGRKLRVIEDCAQAHGARYRGASVGTFGDIGSWSFCQDKIITTGGEGGMVTTDNEELWGRMWSRKDHGKSVDLLSSSTRGTQFRWVHDALGTNWRMTEMQAAIGRLQLRELERWNAQRTKNAQQLFEACSTCSALRAPMPRSHVRHAWYKFYAFIRPEALRSQWSRERIVHEINVAGVSCSTGSCPEIYLERAFEGTGWRPKERLPVAKMLGETSLMFQVHPTLKQDELDRMCEVVCAVMKKAAY